MRRHVLIMAAIAMLSGCGRAASELPVLPVGGDFTLTDDHGQRFDSASLRGKAVLVFFGYTFCPDVCPTTLSKISAVTRKLAVGRGKIKTVYITVDPARDTPDVMREHLSQFGLDAVGLTGSDREIAAVAKQFGAAYELVQTDSAARYLVAHSTTLYAIDAKGQTRILFRYEATVDEIVDGLRRLLQGT